jgi:hypothetical protein
MLASPVLEDVTTSEIRRIQVTGRRSEQFGIIRRVEVCTAVDGRHFERFY